MKHIFLVLFTLLTGSIFGQIVRVDSTVIHESRDIYNQAGYFIGSDSFHVKSVRLAYCGDTFYARTDTLIERRPMLFITMDSIGAGTLTEAQGDDRYVNENVVDTITVNKVITDSDVFKFGTGAGTMSLSHTGLISTHSTGTTVHVTPSTIEVYDAAAGITEITATGTTVTRDGYTITADDLITLAEAKSVVNDSIDLTITSVTDGTTIDFTKTGRVLTGEVKTNSIDSTHLKVNSVKGSELEDVATAGTYNYGTYDINGRFISGSLLAYQTGTQVRDSIGLLDADHDGDADDAELLQGANGSYYRSRSNHTGVQDTSTITALDEFVEDRMGGKILAGTNVTVSYNDGTGEKTINAAGTNLTITGSSPYTLASSTGTDVVFKAGTNITLSESGDTMTITGSGGGSGLTDEQVRDTVAAFLREGLNGAINLTESDGGDSLVIAAKVKELNENILWDTDSHYCIWNGASQANATITWGCHVTLTGSVPAVTMASTNIFTSTRRTELSGSAATNSVAGWRETACTFWLGNGTGKGGFTYKSTWGPTTGLTSNSTHRAFCGMKDGTANPSDVDPSTLTSMFGMGWDDSDTNIQFMHNDGSGTATKVDLGASFPKPTTNSTDFYKLEMWAEPNGSTVYYKVTDMNDLTTASGSVSTDLPTSFFGPRLYCSAGGTSTTIGVAQIKLNIKTAY